MPLNEAPPKKKMNFKSKLIQSRAFLQYYLTPEILLLALIVVSAVLAFLNIQSWFFVLAPVFSVGYFAERIARSYGRKKDIPTEQTGDPLPAKRVQKIRKERPQTSL